MNVSYSLIHSFIHSIKKGLNTKRNIERERTSYSILIAINNLHLLFIIVFKINSFLYIR